MKIYGKENIFHKVLLKRSLFIYFYKLQNNNEVKVNPSF
ncbi:hypothetical protein MNBD_BACTEROID01-1885 [hydrothermal vent metagenome]|uniref:Uncharacterized protein n=1 Tax=hydrothermal vent metagenome TaxID=652676 RepID=A0A3B0TYY4_9ZZZZ